MDREIVDQERSQNVPAARTAVDASAKRLALRPRRTAATAHSTMDTLLSTTPLAGNSASHGAARNDSAVPPYSLPARSHHGSPRSMSFAMSPVSASSPLNGIEEATQALIPSPTKATTAAATGSAPGR